jgi:hypothetical protein
MYIYILFPRRLTFGVIALTKSYYCLNVSSYLVLSFVCVYVFCFCSCLLYNCHLGY